MYFLRLFNVKFAILLKYVLVTLTHSHKRRTDGRGSRTTVFLSPSSMSLPKLCSPPGVSSPSPSPSPLVVPPVPGSGMVLPDAPELCPWLLRAPQVSQSYLGGRAPNFISLNLQKLSGSRDDFGQSLFFLFFQPLPPSPSSPSSKKRRKSLPPPSSANRGPFYFFLLEWREELRKIGETFE